MIPPSIKEKMGRNLHLKERHPLEIIKKAIYMAFPGYETYETFTPIVTVEDNFDHLLIPADHPSRRPSDTYYVDETHVLRTHTSAHQHMLINKGHMKFLVCGDVYRRDAIDKTHYPVFHQVEGVGLFHKAKYQTLDLEKLLKEHMFDMAERVFDIPRSSRQLNYRFVDSYFPFTNPSWELEIEWNGEWLEVAGCGIVHPDVIKRCEALGPLGDNYGDYTQGWAFGVGLERLAMLAFDIPDIRLFWSEDERFLNQFKDLDSRFKPFSDQPACYKDMAFWIPAGYSENDFYQIVRDLHGDLVESVKLVDSFKKGERESHCYRIIYRSMERTLTNEEINQRQQQLRDRMKELKVEIR